MIAKKVHGATHVFGAPGCYDIHVRALQLDDGTLMATTSWEPTPDELATLNAGGSVVLTTLGWQPPVVLSVEPFVDECCPADVGC